MMRPSETTDVAYLDIERMIVPQMCISNTGLLQPWAWKSRRPELLDLHIEAITSITLIPHVASTLTPDVMTAGFIACDIETI